MEADDECAAYAGHLHHEHHRLNRLLLEIGHEVGQLAGAQADRRVVQRLETRITDLLSQLKTHFAEEESGGCLEEAVSRCPSLAGETETILKEHQQLDQLLCRVLSQISDSATPADNSGELAGFLH